MGDCQDYDPFLDPYYNTGPNTGPNTGLNLGDPKRDHNFDNPPHVHSWAAASSVVVIGCLSFCKTNPKPQPPNPKLSLNPKPQTLNSP